jgi:hypothetical protein
MLALPDLLRLLADAGAAVRLSGDAVQVKGMLPEKVAEAAAERRLCLRAVLLLADLDGLGPVLGPTDLRTLAERIAAEDAEIAGAEWFVVRPGPNVHRHNGNPR